ncbi:hypothetical protein P8452_20586 [Trifolium repens]|nr:hypothetical protein P8452_20586 [Trifolium repens]
MSSKIKSLEKSMNSLHSEFSEIKTIVLDIKEFFDEWKEKQSVEESERSSDEMQSSESEEQCRPLGWVDKDKQRFKEKLRVKTNELEKLELEIRNLNASLILLKDFEIEELRKKLDALMKELRNKEYSLHKLEESNKRLIIKESKSNGELQYARKKLINTIKETSTRDGSIGVKKMGEFNTKSFIDAMKKRYNEDEAEHRGAKLWSLWKENINDPNWNPFKVVFVDGVAKQVIIKTNMTS